MTNEKEIGFYVEENECVTCGCCESVAPKLFHHNKTSFVKKQPETSHELRTMFRASRVCIVDCIYYDGKDQLLTDYFLKIRSCFERNGNVCSLDNCPCFNSFLVAQAETVNG